jgi:P-type E1-E2 ATPase
MVGDGGNDCGALRAAHVGLALSDGDASIVAPLTSLKKDILDVLKVIKEGRGSVASTMAAYKYVVLYGNTSSVSDNIGSLGSGCFGCVYIAFVLIISAFPFSISVFH